MPVEFSFATFWPLLAKAQATALEGELKVRSLHLPHTKAIKVRARLAGQRSWHHYKDALERGAGSINALIGLENRLQAILAKEGLVLSSEDAQQVLARMEEAGLPLLHRAVMDLRLHVALYPVTGTPLNLRTLDQQLMGVDERHVLDDLEQARPNITALFDEPELLPLLALLSEQEGPGVLADLHTAEESTWVYVQDERQALLLALAQASLPDLYGDPSVPFGWSQAQLCRTTPPSFEVSLAAQLFKAQISLHVHWGDLWLKGNGLAERLTQLEGRLERNFPFGASLPNTLTPKEAHLAFWDALEAVALRSRQSSPHTPNWYDLLDEGALKALHSSLDREVHGVLRGARTRFPAAAQVDIRAAVAAGLPISDLLTELEVLLEDQQWHARRRIWQDIWDLREVQLGDTLCINGGQPFQVQAIAGIQDFTLSVTDHQGRSRAIKDSDDLERQIIAQV